MAYDAKKIKVLKGLEGVRKRPAMYIGDTGERGLHHLVFEVVDNSIDEAMVGYCDRLSITIHNDESVTIIDNGRGIPVDKHPTQNKSALEVVMTMLHAGGKFDSKAYRISGGLHGVGISVVNALSEYMLAEVMRDGKHYQQKYERGKPVTPVRVIGKTKEKGTKITFRPDKEIFGEFAFKYDLLSSRLRELAFLNKGIQITLIDERDNRTGVFRFDGGIKEFIEYIDRNKKPLHRPPIYISKRLENMEIEVAMQYNDSYQENIFSFANNINTIEGGSHLIGLKTALTRTFNDFAKRNKLVKESEPAFSGDDVREGLTAVISLKIQEPQFEGQTKTKLGNPEVRSIVDSAVSEGLVLYLEEHPSESKKIIDRIKLASRARIAAKKAKELTRRKNALDSADLPGKLADCSTKNPEEAELFIVEGDSAGGSAKQGRDRIFQAVLPLRGKILNVEKARLDKMLNNDTIKTIVSALGTGIGRDDFNIDKLRYHKVIIMTDADVDGSHIKTLLLTFFFRYAKELIEKGFVYIALPPLYNIKKGKKEHYAYSDDELKKITAKLGNGVQIQRYKGLGEMNPEQLWMTTMNPETRLMKRASLEDAYIADQVFTVLMGDEVAPRREFIITNAKFVKNLDI
ncbi:DNA topoisomerase (ATP-hydrolyzing) subunit B [candidate division WOR-3 bacterium]|nr:DNA topoisomerase (ATP-hydrolyzing) subunit B [candidate division WOR-3 bacterium]